MVEFGEYLMPMRYLKTSISEEHLAVREKMGMFDTSHMGRIKITGKDSLEFLNILVPRDLTKLSDGSSGYTFILNENGGFKDDVIITRFSLHDYLLVCNSSNINKILTWVSTIQLLLKEMGKDIVLNNQTSPSSMIAIQGPMAISLIEKLSNIKLTDKRFRVNWIKINEIKVLYSTTGYTGSSGCELLLFDNSPSLVKHTESIWDLFIDNGVTPCALGSRDTLRQEAGYRLYGNDLNENLLLTESGLNFPPFVHMGKNFFIGKDVIMTQPAKKTVVGFQMIDKGIPRHNYRVMKNGNEIGIVFSGTQSPLKKVGFGLMQINTEFAEIGTKIKIDIHGKMKTAEIINLPLYDEQKYGIGIRKPIS